MANPNPTPTPDRPSPSNIDQSQLDELDLAEAVAQAALEEPFRTELADEDVDPAETAALLDDIAAARETAGQAIGGTAAFHGVTDAEELAKQALLAVIRTVQKRAKRKYEETDPAQLRAFFVNERVDTRTRLLTAAVTILRRVDPANPALKNLPPALQAAATKAAQPTTAKTKAKAAAAPAPAATPATPDTLPGQNAVKTQALADAFVTYRDINTAQARAQGTASGARGTLGQQVAAIAVRRRNLQLAADTIYPPNPADAAVSAIRRRFHLPEGQALA